MGGEDQAEGEGLRFVRPGLPGHEDGIGRVGRVDAVGLAEDRRVGEIGVAWHHLVDDAEGGGLVEDGVVVGVQGCFRCGRWEVGSLRRPARSLRR